MSFLGGLFGGGGGGGQPQLKNVNITSPGFRLTSRGDGDTLNTTLRRTGSPAQSRFDTRLPRILGDVDTLRGTIRPGFSDLRASRLNAIQQGRSRALSNIRGAFSDRRLSGSSFAAGSIANAEREFAQAEGDALSQSFLEELQANVNILNQEFSILGTDLDREFAELGLAAGTGVSIAQILSSNAQSFLQSQASQQAAAGGFLGSAANLGLASVSRGGPFATSAAQGGGLVGGSFGGLSSADPGLSGADPGL